MRVLAAILLLLFLLLQFKLWFGDGGFRAVTQLEARVAAQAEENETLLQRNRELQAEVEDLRERLDAIEERARSELGLIKEGEEFYQVVPAPGAEGSGGG
ncbi:MAG: cell division protein FtsB [Xanthomonadales bacterium]|nr:cell division protein FtsB [Xanthomonadales bacterium]